MEARKLVKKGCRWHVGDGNQINIWMDYWVPGYRELQSVVANGDTLISKDKVASLIDRDTGWWDV